VRGTNHLQKGQVDQELDICPLPEALRVARDASIPTLVWQAIWLRALGPKKLGHDVSGTSCQILVRAMLLITTMMPAWQCGHSLRDRPVSALKRSR
jgi:hypothetical protein